MKLAVAALPAPFLIERRVLARNAGEGWHELGAALAEAGIPDGPAPGDVAGAFAFLSALGPAQRRRIERALDQSRNGLAVAALDKPIGPDAKLFLTEGRIALARSNDVAPAKRVVGFSKFESALAAPGRTIRLPNPGARYDVEATLCAIVGRAANRAARSEAARAIVGFTLMAEVTNRNMFDEEAATRNNLYAKNEEALSPFGPCVWIASARELDPATEVTLKVNGAERQRFAVSDLAHTMAAAVGGWSRAVLVPGDAVALGAAIARPRAGNAVDSPVPVAPGDAIEIACAPIGVLAAKFA
jgi:2-keto-4-pentenoate hydratase/2-oxohepta-3-ene-1,7-dioic acid hydratase in catechol pathway